MEQKIINEINIFKEKRKAVIVAHNYQREEVQEIADMIGDSFALSRFCASTDAEVIVFCGVRFMAESAKILSPGKTVLLPAKSAGCPLADMITVKDIMKLKKAHPQAAVVCYINSSAEVKAESDICCTSSNAINVVKSLKERDVIFIPDKNLGSYVAEKVPEKNIILWEGFCPIHNNVSVEHVIKAKQMHPEAILLMHPECRKEVLEMADFIGSTKEIIDYGKNSIHKEFIIGTEIGVITLLKKNNPEKKFYPLYDDFICPDMKKITLESIFKSLKNLEYEILLDEEIRINALKSLQKMLEIS